ncbi:MAG: response regulator transcription factor [Desulfobacteraceae bacterium]|nr:response regulator transcription factor [Desulfobacteraceae bacterium]
MPDPKTVLIVDRSSFGDDLKEEIEADIGYETVGHVSDPLEGIQLSREFKPDIVVIDILVLGKIDSLELTQIIKGSLENTCIVIVSSDDQPDLIIRSMMAGALGYVVKDSGTDTVLQCFKMVTEGKRFIDPSVAASLLDMPKVYQSQEDEDIKKYELLTLKEQEVMCLLAEGLDLTEISEQLGISYDTVSSHKSDIMKKLDFKSVIELARLAADLGITD